MGVPRRLSSARTALLAFLAAPATAQFPNDDCAGAIPVFDGTSSPATNSGSSTSLPPWACGAGTNDLWYAYAASCTGIATVGLCGAGTANFDTALSVYAGTCAAPILLACNDDSCGLRSEVAVPVTAGAVYLVRVGGFGGEVGNFTLAISCSGTVLPNDECAGAIPIADGLNPPASNAGATLSLPPWPCSNGGADVWFTYTPSCTDLATFTFCPGGVAGFDTLLAVYDGSCGAPNLLGCDDDTCGLASEVTVPVSGGVPVLVRVGGFAGNTGTFSLFVHHGGSYAFAPTGCGAPTLTPSGAPELGQSVSFTLAGWTGGPAIWAGAPVNVPFCPPAPCALGATFGVLLVGTATLAAQVPCDPALAGATVAVQGADLFAPGGCAALFPFALSDTVLVTIG